MSFEKQYELLVKLLPQVLPLIQPAINARYYPWSIEKRPVLSYRKNGFPDFSEGHLDDISRLFRQVGNGEPNIDPNDYPEYIQLLSLVMETPQIKSYFTTWIDDETRADSFYKLLCENFILDFIERFYLLHGSIFDEALFRAIFEPVANFLCAEDLHFDISIPILFVQFDTDSFEIAPGLELRRISDEAHRARTKIIAYSPAIASSVYMSATHELVLKDYSYKRPSRIFDSSFSNAALYPTSQIQRFLTVLKVVTDCTSGYAQFLLYPNNWVDRYKMDLMYLQGASTRNYPSFFDNFYWNEENFPVVSSDELKKIASLYTSVDNSKENKLEFALRRYYKSILREEEEDVIVDLIIALEMLLSDKEKGEITHKLALRMAALLSVYAPGTYDAVQVFANVKKIYDYRSLIVHGGHKIHEKREIKLEGNVTVPKVALAKQYLGAVLEIVISEPKYLNPSEIDKLLLEGRL
ncbi:hypothetical protein [Dyadobacter sp. OTU695]|uniref:hypothetical protein n=1 Tax=Dyadobacter sp. OTU695 TaxID=3043860 RepID=UPI00313D17E3